MPPDREQQQVNPDQEHPLVHLRHLPRQKVGVNSDLYALWTSIRERILELWHSPLQDAPSYFCTQDLPFQAAVATIADAKGHSERHSESADMEVRMLIRQLIRPPNSVVDFLKSRFGPDEIPDYYKVAEEARIQLERELRRRRLSRRGVTDFLAAFVERKDDGGVVDGQSVLFFNRDFSHRQRVLRDVCLHYGVRDFPEYMEHLMHNLVQDPPINVAKAWKVSPEYLRELSRQANLLANSILSLSLHPEVAATDDAHVLQGIVRHCDLSTEDHFHRVRSANAKLRFMYVLYFVQGQYDPDRVKILSGDLSTLLQRVCTNESDGVVLNRPPSSVIDLHAIDGISVKVRSVSVDPGGKSLASVARKFSAMEEGHFGSIRDLVRCMVELHPDDCRTVPDIIAAAEKILAIVLAVLGTSTVQDVDYINIIPLQPGDENMDLPTFMTAMASRGVTSGGGMHGFSSSAFRAIGVKVSWPQNNRSVNRADPFGHAASVAQTVEVQIRLPTPDDHDRYEDMQRAKISEACAFGTPNGAVTFEQFVRDLIEGFSMRGVLGVQYAHEVDEYHTRPVHEMAILHLLHILTRESDGVLVNRDLIQRLRTDGALYQKLMFVLKDVFRDYRPFQSALRRRRQRFITGDDQEPLPQSLAIPHLRKKAIRILTQGESYQPETRTLFIRPNGTHEIFRGGSIVERRFLSGEVHFFDDRRRLSRKNLPDGQTVIFHYPQHGRRGAPREEIIPPSHRLTQIPEVNGLKVYKKEWVPHDKQQQPRIVGYIEEDVDTGNRREYLEYDIERRVGHHLVTEDFPHAKRGEVRRRQYSWGKLHDSHGRVVADSSSQCDGHTDFFAINDDGHTYPHHFNVYRRRRYGPSRLVIESRVDSDDGWRVTRKIYRYRWFGLRRVLESEEVRQPTR